MCALCTMGFRRRIYSNMPEKKRCKMEVDACARMRFSYDNGEKFMFERNVFSLCGLL